MAAGKQGSKDVVVTYDDGGGVARIITNFVMTLGGAKIAVATEPSHAFGDAWDEHTPTGQRSSPDIPVSGMLDTTLVTGPHVVFMPNANDADPNGTTRTLAILYGDGKTFTVETRLVEYEVAGENEKLTKFNALIRPTGAAAWT